MTSVGRWEGGGVRRRLGWGVDEVEHSRGVHMRRGSMEEDS